MNGAACLGQLILATRGKNQACFQTHREPPYGVHLGKLPRKKAMKTKNYKDLISNLQKVSPPSL